MKMVENIIKGIIYSRFDDRIGPIPVVSKPEDLENKVKKIISLKSINLLIGENDYIPESLAILPFPSTNLKGLIKITSFKDKGRRGGIVDSSLTLLFDEADDSIFYKYITNFSEVFKKSSSKLIELEQKKAAIEEIYQEIDNFHRNLVVLLKDLSDAEIKEAEQEAFPKDDILNGGSIKFRYKIVVVGDPAVGKTSLILRFTDKAFKRTYLPTMGVNISEKNMIHDNDTVEYILWDVAGQAKFQMMRKHFYEGSDAQILVFDLTRYNTFNNVKEWYNDIKNLLSKDIPGIILANKYDLTSDIKINEEEIRALSDELGLKYIVTSALTGENVDASFFELAGILKQFYKK